jgi:hypothetical protein
MRGIADTAYVLHEWGRCTFSLRKLIMFIACLEAHLIPVVTLTSLVILPVYYNIFMLLSTGEARVKTHSQAAAAVPHTPQLTLQGLILSAVSRGLQMRQLNHTASLSAAAAGHVPSPMSLPAPMRVLALLGQGNLIFVLLIICCYETIRSIVRRHVYRLMDNDKHERCWWNCPRFVLHCLNYLTLFVSVWVYTVVPVVLVVGKHMFNVRR